MNMWHIKMHRWMLSAFVLLPLSAFSQSQIAQTDVVIDGTSSGRIFEGIGAVSAGASSRLLIDYPEPQRSQILDYLFKPGYGASLQHLKVEIGADMNSTDGSEPSYARTPVDQNYARGYEWWLMTEARKRNPKIVLDTLPWGAPGWVGKFYSRKTADYIANFIRGAKRTYGLDIAYTGIWNETAYNPHYVTTLRQVLDKAGLKGTKIVCCDDYTGHQWDVVTDMQHDSTLRSTVAVVGVHSARIDGKFATPPDARTAGKPLWSSEDKPDPRHTSRDWATGGRSLAQIYNDNYLKGGFTATEIWSPVTSYYDILAAPNSGLMYANTPWSGNYDVQGAIWATAHTTQFTQPGWRYLDSSCGYLPETGDFVALKSPNGKDWSVVLQTIGAEHPQRVGFHIQGGLKANIVHIWETNSTKTFEHVADVPTHEARFSFTFDPDSLYSLTTTEGQGKGTAAPPPSSLFPFPWHESFGKVRLHGTPIYLSDQDGAFQVEACIGRGGRCLEQVITRRPIPWGSTTPDPWTLAGNEQWKDYRVGSEVHIMGQGTAMLLGRIDSANVFKDQKAEFPSGYVFQITSEGVWSLLSPEYKKPTRTLAQGRFQTNGSGWHRMNLDFRANQISISLDGKMLASIHDDAHSRGMVGLGAGWNRVQFGHFSVERP
jgi:galactosylceramidase